MTRSLALFASAAIVVVLSAPARAEAQAQRRGGSDSGSSSGGASRGGDSGGGGVAVPRSSPPPASAPAPMVRERPSRPASVASRPSGYRSTAESSRVGPEARTAGAGSASMRLRSTQAVRGVAQPRSNFGSAIPPRPRDTGYRWSPWYGYGYGYGYGPGYYGSVLYNPWIYGGSSFWSWNRYAWHDPFLYDPYGYAGYPYYWRANRIGTSASEPESRAGLCRRGPGRCRQRIRRTVEPPGASCGDP
jgi:hypothetical protein